MNCRSCGNRLSADDVFCANCGTRQDSLPIDTASTVLLPAGGGVAAAAAEPGPPARGGRGKLYAIAGVGAVLVLAAVLAVVFVVLPLLTPSGFRTAAFAPKDTWLYATMTLRPGAAQLKNLNSVVEAFSSQPGFAEALKSQQNQGDMSQVDFEQDILPLLDGEVSVAAWGTTQEPSAVILAHSSDPEKLLRVLAQKGNSALLEPNDQYKGAAFSPKQAQGKTADSAAAAYKGWAIIGKDENAVKQTVDRIQAGSAGSLAENPRYTQVLDRLPKDRLGFAYVDSTTVLGDAITSGDMNIPGAVTPYLEQYQGRAALAIAAGSQSLDLTWESIPNTTPPAPKQSAKGDTVAAFQVLPTDTLVAVGGHDAPALFSGMDDTLNGFLATQTDGSGQTLQVHFSRWLGGEFAAGLNRGTVQLEAPDGWSTSGTPNVYLVAKVRDVSAAEQDLSGFDALVNPQRISVNGSSFRQLEAGPNQRVTYGIFSQRFYIIGGQINPVLNGTGKGLLDNPRYQAVQDTIASDGVSFFADLDGIRSLADDLTPSTDKQGDRFYGQRTRPFVTPLHALAGSWRTDGDGAAHGKLTLNVQK